MKVTVIKIKITVKEYLIQMKPYLKDTITNLQKSGTWKVQLTIAVNVISCKDNDEEQVMHSKSDNLEVMTIMQMKLLKKSLNHFFQNTKWV